jgi:hypothetical protein
MPKWQLIATVRVEILRNNIGINLQHNQIREPWTHKTKYF